MGIPKLIDNKRILLANLIKDLAPKHDELSIATGYWDLEGTLEIIESIKNYKKIRLIIGEEPMSPIQKYTVTMNFDLGKLTFPKDYIEYDLAEYSKAKDASRFREVTSILSNMIKEGRLEVKVFNDNRRLHAKAYIFGNEKDPNAVGIIGSSNFTKAGLTSNTELNSLEDQPPMVVYKSPNENMPHTHLSWFNELWDDEKSINWTGTFKETLEKSPVGELTYGPYDVYIKTLMEVFSDELNPPKDLGEQLSKTLFPFQNRNAGLLINKLEKIGMAMLADSVGLGKTITAGAVIKHYLDTKENCNVLVIAPAALKKQWINDLSNIVEVDQITGDYTIISQQDYNALRELKQRYDEKQRLMRKIDLIVIDEAHNLRTPTGVRYEAILDLLQQHPDSKILLLTATPVNNSIIDIANQLKLASKGRRTFVNVPYSTPDNKEIEMLDYFVALDRIQKYIRIREKRGENIDNLLEFFKPTIHSGLRHFLVRSTRQGVQAEGSLKNKNGEKINFPKSIVSNLNYSFKDNLNQKIVNLIENNNKKIFEGNNPRILNLNLFSEITQQTSHPLDILNQYKKENKALLDKYKIKNSAIEKNGKMYHDISKTNAIENIVQAIFMIGFVPYRPHMYDSKYYNKSLSELEKLNEIPLNVKIQLSVHNIMHVTWLKRLESSGHALLMSLRNYERRLKLFDKYLNKNLIVNQSDADLLESDYGDGDDLERAFDDFDKYIKEREKILEEGGDENALKKKGVEKIYADPNVFNISQMKHDIGRDLIIIKLLEEILIEFVRDDSKVIQLKESIIDLVNKNKYGKKVILFSFFADTINYLGNVLPEIFKNSNLNFDKTSEFITGSSNNIDNLVGRFSPISKNYTLKEGEKELNFLFSTDVLSEGQNLQDSGILINYDLHWNPVRMIQRNGRINRIGSKFNEVMISNMKPSKDLDLYLNLVSRLESKIATIKKTVGLDQGVLDQNDENPIQFIEKYYNDGEFPDLDDKLLAHTDEHLIALRKFLDSNKDNVSEIERVKGVPIGKWSYLPEKNSKKRFNAHSLALVSVSGVLNKADKITKDLFFIEVECFDFYKATYIDYNLALDLIKTNNTDNEKSKDKISYDRFTVLNRAINESKRQFNNPKELFNLKPLQIKIVQIMGNYFDKKVDIIGTLRFGIRTTNIQNEFEGLIREISAELKLSNTNSPNATTVNKFVAFINKLNKNLKISSETKIIDKIEGVLFYAAK
jgi:ERCC4-related helicase